MVCIDFTKDFARVLQLADRIARRQPCQWCGTEHLVLGLLDAGESKGCRLLAEAGIDLGTLRREVAKCCGPGPDRVTAGLLPLSPRSIATIGRAFEASRQMYRNSIDTDHLVLGLLHERGGVASQVLAHYGLNLDELRRRCR